MISRIRKAVVAGVGAGAGAAVAVIAKANWHLDHTTLTQALAAAIAVGGPVAWTTWRVPNAPKYATGGPVR
ncbi:hypothetical protein GCM10010168_85740 [Actinoplanes ianthinogenes]|uniref:Secreted protein n=1 Tax=Actinoplanes ianthinogenes TaxID=122358 RepID=A0ABN6CIC9_9ACTN|nr:hypothetical protein [Actinoplanes ianthinogenes]BCJ45305.1 hypothetical protein Aiant_59620 [Actinoplanes ianthinogenes]GGR53677.1 hypothetical protein GCM10010168_85740 [Actinoplanes ianthinogenes]